MASAIENAGFSIRDQLQWIYGSGFPKSLDVGKAVRRSGALSVSSYQETQERSDSWEGFGTALKPSHEPICMARKPFRGNVAGNVLRFRTGALNIDACRIELKRLERNPTIDRRQGSINFLSTDSAKTTDIEGRFGNRTSPERYRSVRPGEEFGRWPANVILDEEAGELLDEQTGVLASGNNPARRSSSKFVHTYMGFKGDTICQPARFTDRGGASRFFYCAKTSRKEREAGMHEAGMSGQIVNDGRHSLMNTPFQRGDTVRRNTHPTVKPIALMRWLVRLVTPPAGIVLDPFMGSGSTGIACKLEEFDFIGCELLDEYVEIAIARIEAA